MACPLRLPTVILISRSLLHSPATMYPPSVEASPDGTVTVVDSMATDSGSQSTTWGIMSFFSRHPKAVEETSADKWILLSTDDLDQPMVRGHRHHGLLLDISSPSDSDGVPLQGTLKY